MASFENIYEFVRINSTYQQTKKIVTPARIWEMKLFNKLVGCSHVDTYIRFYRLPEYGLEEAFVAGSIIRYFSEANNGSLIAAGSTDLWVRVFAFDGSGYTQTQAIYVGFVSIFIKIT